jgi:hypothetical protein
MTAVPDRLAGWSDDDEPERLDLHTQTAIGDGASSRESVSRWDFNTFLPPEGVGGRAPATAHGRSRRRKHTGRPSTAQELIARLAGGGAGRRGDLSAPSGEPDTADDLAAGAAPEVSGPAASAAPLVTLLHEGHSIDAKVIAHVGESSELKYVGDAFTCHHPAGRAAQWLQVQVVDSTSCAGGVVGWVLASELALRSTQAPADQAALLEPTSLYQFLSELVGSSDSFEAPWVGERSDDLSQRDAAAVDRAHLLRSLGVERVSELARCDAALLRKAGFDHQQRAALREALRRHETRHRMAAAAAHRAARRQRPQQQAGVNVRPASAPCDVLSWATAPEQQQQRRQQQHSVSAVPSGATLGPAHSGGAVAVAAQRSWAGSRLQHSGAGPRSGSASDARHQLRRRASSAGSHLEQPPLPHRRGHRRRPKSAASTMMTDPGLAAECQVRSCSWVAVPR